MKTCAFATMALFGAANAWGSSKCYGLAMSSADESAAYQAGVLKGFAANLPADEIQYTAVSGVAASATNAVLFSSFAKGKEVDAADRLVQFWENASNSKLYQDWWGGVANGLLWKGGLYDSSPFKTFLEREFTDVTKIQRSVNVGITDALTGKFDEFTESNILSSDNLITAMYGSFANPGFFPPEDAQGTKYFDGSVTWDLDIFSVVNKCLESHKESDIVVDVIMTSSNKLKEVEAENYGSISMMFRYRAISSYYGSMDGLVRAQFAYPNVTFRYVVQPTKDIPSSLWPYNAGQKKMDKVISYGVADAEAIIAGNSANGNGTEDVLHYYSLKKNGDKRMNEINYGEFLEQKEAGEFGSYNAFTDKSNPLHLIQ